MTWPFDLTFEVDFDTNPAGTPSAWVDLSNRLRANVPAVVEHGATDNASCTLTLNNFDRLFDPTNLSSPYNLVPMRHARLSVTVGATTFVLFRGFVEEWPPSWPGYGTGLVDVRLVDAVAWLALQDGDVEQPRQLTGQRINQLLDQASWPAGLRDIDAGQVTVVGVEQVGANFWRVIEDTADAEDGELWVSPTGVVTFRDRHHRLEREPQIVVGAGGVGFTDVRPSYGGAVPTNIVRVEREDGDQFNAVNETSIGKFGPRSMSIRDLALPDHESVGLAQWAVYRLAEPKFPDGTPKLWLEELTFNGHDPGVLDAVVPRGLGDLVDFVTQPPGGGTAEALGHIEKVTHRIGWDTWETSWGLSPYFGEGPWAAWVSDVATEGSAWVSEEATEGSMWAP